MCRFDSKIQVWRLGDAQEQYDMQSLQDGSRLDMKQSHNLALTLNCPVSLLVIQQRLTI